MPEQADYNLTPHEARLLRLLMEGHSYKTGAAAMSVSFNTISFHMKNVYQKLQCIPSLKLSPRPSEPI